MGFAPIDGSIEGISIERVWITEESEIMRVFEANIGESFKRPGL